MVLIIASVTWMVTCERVGAVTVTADGKDYEDAELFEIGAKGPFYKVGEGQVVVVPWAQVDRFQAASIRKRFAKALVNLRQKAYWVQGTVFEKNEAGIIIHTGSSSGNEDDSKKETRKDKAKQQAEEKLARNMSNEGEAVFKDGAEVATGLVVLKDLPRTQYGVGSDVAVIAYRVGELSYEMGLGMKKKIMVCNLAKPEWIGVRKWKNSSGKDMTAELVAVKGGKCLFQRNGKNFVYDLDQLCGEDQKLVADFQKNSREIPLKKE
ncbi:MAG: hypothetical protein L3J39_00545 [Verrucomicrobiales bacterium]|nr:hypothetical protein [Verrucomicrobiales bacterium]